MCKRLLGGRGVVLRVMFHPKQLMLVTAGEDAEVRVWDLVDKSCVAVLKVRPRACSGRSANLPAGSGSGGTAQLTRFFKLHANS